MEFQECAQHERRKHDEQLAYRHFRTLEMMVTGYVQSGRSGLQDSASQGRHTHDEQQPAANATWQSSHMIDYVAMFVVYRRVFHVFELRM